MQFGDDWRGYFIRGDNAGHFAVTLRMALDALKRGEKPSAMDLLVLDGYAQGLASSDERVNADPIQRLKSWKECVEP